MDLDFELLSLYQNADINFVVLQLEKIIMKEWTGGFINRIFPKLDLSATVGMFPERPLCTVPYCSTFFLFLNFLFIYICLCSDVCYWKLLERYCLKTYAISSYHIVLYTNFKMTIFSEKKEK